MEQALNLHGTRLAKFAVYPEILEQAGYRVGSTGKGCGPGFLVGRTRNVAGRAGKNFNLFLAARPKDQPFCFWFGSHYLEIMQARLPYAHQLR